MRPHPKRRNPAVHSRLPVNHSHKAAAIKPKPLSSSKVMLSLSQFEAPEAVFSTHLASLQCQHLHRFVHLHFDFNHFHSFIFYITPFCHMYVFLFYEAVVCVFYNKLKMCTLSIRF